MRRALLALAIGVLVGLGGVVLGITPPGAALERTVGLPWLFARRGVVAPPSEVVVVGIDSRTGAQLGLPDLPREWPRSIHARLIEALNARGAAVIVFDVHFAEQRDPTADAEFAEAVAQAGNVVLVERLSGKREPLSDSSGRHVGAVWKEQLLPPFPALAAAAAGLAIFPLPKEAAAVHEFWVFKESADRAPTLPAVALQLKAPAAARALAEQLGVPAAVAPGAEGLRAAMRAMRAAAVAVPLPDAGDSARTDESGRHAHALAAMYAGDARRTLNFYGPPGTIPNVPYHAVIKGGDPNVPDDLLDFTGEVVFVGFSDLFDPGQPDRFYTVYTRDDGVDLSGVEIAATGYANLLADSSLVALAPLPTVGLLLGFGLALGVLAFLLPAAIGVPLALGLAAAYAFLAQRAFGGHALVLPLATPLLVQVPVALLVGLLGQYLSERRRGQRISAAINYYLPEAIAQDLARNRLDESRLNQVVYATCFATDMAGFSTIAEQLPPRELAVFLNEYFETLAAPLKAHGVDVTEFRADAIMCAWTAPQASPVPRERALLAALDAAHAIKAFKQRHALAAARLRIGLEVGFVYVGHAGGGGHFVYSIVGDSANTASRVEGLNKHVGTEVLATGAVIEGIAGLVTRYLGDFQFVGKSEALAVHELIARAATATPAELALRDGYAAAMSAYTAGDWAVAASAFEAFLGTFPGDGPATYMLARCRRYLQEPPSGPDPHVVRMDSK